MSGIQSRASWGAQHRDGVATRSLGRLEKYLHHSVTKQLPVTASIEEERVQCRVVESIGQARFGAGISYTFLVFPSGRIYQGASVHRVSYHSGGGRDGKSRNTLGVGICLVGNTEANEMTPQQEAAVVWLLRHGVEQGWWQDPSITEGHRDFKSTSCPGKNAYAKIGRINAAARMSGVSAAPTSPTPKTGDDQMAIHWAFVAERADGKGESWYVQDARSTTFQHIAEMSRKATIQRVRELSFPGDKVKDWAERPGGKNDNKVGDPAAFGQYVGDPKNAPKGVYVG